jgi:hypothetical protein
LPLPDFLATVPLNGVITFAFAGVLYLQNIAGQVAVSPA